MSAKNRSSIDLKRGDGSPDMRGVRQTDDQGLPVMMEKDEIKMRSAPDFDPDKAPAVALNQPASSRPEDVNAFMQQQADKKSVKKADQTRKQAVQRKAQAEKEAAKPASQRAKTARGRAAPARTWTAADADTPATPRTPTQDFVNRAGTDKAKF
jgi:hypothetical protein